MQHSKDEGPFNTIIGFGKIYLQKDSLLPGLARPFHPLPNSNDVVNNVSRLDETSLLRPHNERQHVSDFEGESLGNNLIRRIQKGDGSPIAYVLWITNFRYEFDVSFVDNSS